MILGVPWAGWKEGDRGSRLPSPPRAALPMGMRENGLSSKSSHSRRAWEAGKGSAWEEGDPRVFLSFLPVSPGSVSQGCSGKCRHGNLHWLFPSWGHAPSCAPAVPVPGGSGQPLGGSRRIMENPGPTVSARTGSATACGGEASPECSGACS